MSELISNIGLPKVEADVLLKISPWLHARSKTAGVFDATKAIVSACLSMDPKSFFTHPTHFYSTARTVVKCYMIGGFSLLNLTEKTMNVDVSLVFKDYFTGETLAPYERLLYANTTDGPMYATLGTADSWLYYVSTNSFRHPVNGKAITGFGRLFRGNVNGLVEKPKMNFIFLEKHCWKVVVDSIQVPDDVRELQVYETFSEMEMFENAYGIPEERQKSQKILVSQLLQIAAT